ncbi:MAG: SDR family NAD(P)-dependent oxidoreductase [Bacteroidales bacterium]|nr:SDR family NAD(P)-dependent oxidoreductase [Bacteroidales bacterium]
MNKKLVEKFGPWALITGSARKKGLGFSYAKFLAKNGINIVLVDILTDELNTRKEELSEKYGVEVFSISMDLGQPNFITELTTKTKDIEIGLVVCNHYFTPKDTPKILDMDLDVHCKMIDINSQAYMNILHAYGRKMVKMGRGGLVVIGSGSGIIHAPYTGSYSANKAFQIAMGEVLWYELKDSGVEVITIIAGLMDTQGEALSKYPKRMFTKVEDVVTETFRRIGKTPSIVPGKMNKLVMFLQSRLMSRKAAINSMGSFMGKGLGKYK